jgi:hypothetical protein
MRRSVYKLGTFLRAEDSRSGFVTGVFETAAGIFYQLDQGTSIFDFVAAGDVISIAHMTQVIRKPRRRRAHAKFASAEPTPTEDVNDVGYPLVGGEEAHEAVTHE